MSVAPSVTTQNGAAVSGAHDRPLPKDAAHAIFEVLRDWGIDLVLTCPGSTEAAALDASLAFPDVRLVLTTHESIALAAADGYTRATGKPAVAYLHANVGLANAVAHLTCAARTNSPVIVLNGMKSTEIANRGGFTTSVFQQDYIRQHVRFGRVALRADAIADDLTRAIKAAVAEPGGPVYLGLPQDLVQQPVATPPPAAAGRRVATRRRPDPEAVAAAARLLDGARAVTIVAGAETADPQARAELLALARRLDAPVLIGDLRSLTISAIPGDDPAFAGAYRATHPAVAASDVLLFAGMPAMIEFEPAKSPAIPPGARVIHLCSDPDEIAKIDAVDVGIAANAALALRDLAAALSGASSTERRRHREAAVAEHREATERRREGMRARYGESPIDPGVMMEALNDALPRDCVIVNDAVTSAALLADAVIPGSARGFITSPGGSLGWGMGAALGVQLAKPRERVVCVVGDGVFQFGIQALWTAAALQLPIAFVVVDNRSYAAVKAALKRFRRGGAYAPFPATDISGPQIAEIARGFGAYGETVERLADLHGALERAFAYPGPSVVVVRTDPNHTGGASAG